MVEVFVNMGQIRALKTEGFLTTVGLGSCVGVTMYDAQAKVGVMGHIFYPNSGPMIRTPYPASTQTRQFPP